jgi:hypothetical protein
MILKSLSGKSASYGGLLKYITKDKAVVKDKNGKPILIKHNVAGKTLEEIEKEFLENEMNRAYQRAISNKLYHSIISWHRDDTEALTPEKIEAIAREYFRLLNEDALYVGAIHEDKEHLHLHLCISGTEAYTGKAIRISKAEFQEIKEELQRFELEKYPELVNSVVDFSRKSKEGKSHEEQQLEERTGKMSRKEEVKFILSESFKTAVSREDFYAKVKESGLETYDRGGKTTGIDDTRRMRFSTLGFGEEKLAELDVSKDRLEELEGIREQEIQTDRMQKLDSQREAKETEISAGKAMEDRGVRN